MDSSNLRPILFPELNSTTFGKDLQDRFADIHANFVKLANLEMSKGTQGNSVLYIPINFNTVLFYPTKEGVNEHLYMCSRMLQTLLSIQEIALDDQEFVDNCIKDGSKYVERLVRDTNLEFTDEFDKQLYKNLIRIWKQVDSDYAVFKRYTNLSKYQYSKLVATLLFGHEHIYWQAELSNFPDIEIGKEIEFINTTFTVKPESLCGCIAYSTSSEAQSPVEISVETKKNEKIILYANWMYEWYNRAKVLTTQINSSTPNLSKFILKQGLENSKKLVGDHISNYELGSLQVACAVDNSDIIPCGSLAYVYIDPRFRNRFIGKSEKVVLEHKANSLDVSCVIYWETKNEPKAEYLFRQGKFKCVFAFPRIYFDVEDKQYYWNINGQNTKIKVTGEKGADGKSSQFVVVERVENIIGASPSFMQGNEYFATLKKNVGFWLPIAYNQIKDFQSLTNSPKDESKITRSFMRTTLSHLEYLQLTKDYPNIYGVKGEFNKEGNFKITIKNEAYNQWTVDTESKDNIDTTRLFRIYRIIGKEIFWHSKKTAVNPLKETESQSEKSSAYNIQDPCFSTYNYQDPDEVEIDDSVNIQDIIKNLDGVPCVVFPNKQYTQDKTDSTCWFTTLRAVKPNPKTDKYMLVAYCSSENQLTQGWDDHEFAGAMMDLDVYSYKKTSDNRNMPRGIMLPIGNPKIENIDDKSQQFGAHIIYSDLGGFTEIKIDTETNRKYGVQQSIEKNKVDTLAEGEILGTPDNPVIKKGHQSVSVFGKRVLHIGSVNDFRTLNYVPSFTNQENQVNAAVPGRNPMGVENPQATQYGNSGHYFKDTIGSELHIDEPVTITNYRDTIEDGTKRLLNVEGDVSIGIPVHVNDKKFYSFNTPAGGLYVGSCVTQGILRDWNQIWINHPHFSSIFSSEYFSELTNLYQSTFNMDEDGNYLGPLIPKFGALIESGLGSRFVSTTEGFYLYPTEDVRTNKRAYWSKYSIGNDYITLFSVDRGGNVLIGGENITAYNPITNWIFFSDWNNLLVRGIKKRYELNSISGILPFCLTNTVSSVYSDWYTETYQNKISLDEQIKQKIVFWKDFYFKRENYTSPDFIPLGFHSNLGFFNSQSDIETPHTLKPQKEERLPHVLRLFADTVSMEGSLTVRGLSCLPNKIVQKESLIGSGIYSGYASGQIAHGLYVGGVFYKNIKDLSLIDNFLHQNISVANFCIDNQCKTTNIYTQIPNKLGFSVEESAQFNQNIFVEKNIFTFGDCLVKQDVFASRFLRNTSKQSDLAFMMDNGKSTIPYKKEQLLEQSPLKIKINDREILFKPSSTEDKKIEWTCDLTNKVSSVIGKWKGIQFGLLNAGFVTYNKITSQMYEIDTIGEGQFSIRKITLSITISMNALLVTKLKHDSVTIGGYGLVYGKMYQPNSGDEIWINNNKIAFTSAYWNSFTKRDFPSNNFPYTINLCNITQLFPHLKDVIQIYCPKNEQYFYINSEVESCGGHFTLDTNGNLSYTGLTNLLFALPQDLTINFEYGF